MPFTDLEDLKDELGIKTTAQDFELVRKLDEAEAEYAARVRPLPGTYTETVSLPAFLPDGVTSVTAALPVSAAPVAVLFAGRIVTSTSPLYSAPRVVLTYTVGPIPLHHAGAIIADVAEWYTRTQRGGGSSRPSFGGDASLEPDTPSRPRVLYPRIRDLAGPVVV